MDESISNRPIFENWHRSVAFLAAKLEKITRICSAVNFINSQLYSAIFKYPEVFVLNATGRLPLLQERQLNSGHEEISDNARKHETAPPKYPH